MTPSLYIQNDLFWEDDYATPNIQAASPYFNCIPMDDEWVMGLKREDRLKTPMFMRGSMHLAQVSNLNMKHANVMSWLPVLREFCISQDGFFSDLAHIHKEMPCDLFVRPASLFKEFAGQVFTRERLATEIAFMQQNKNIQPQELMCMAAEPRKIAKEWRLIFVNNKYVSSSQYMTDGELDVKPVVDKEVIAYGEIVAAHPFFLNLFDFVIDIGEVDGKLGVVELNGFETASFYAADLDKIYKAWRATHSSWSE